MSKWEGDRVVLAIVVIGDITMLTTLTLFLSLADPSFDVREQSESDLLALVDGWPDVYGPQIAFLASLATDPETYRRAQHVARSYDRRRAADYTPQTVPFWPCSDCYPLWTPLGDIRDRNALIDGHTGSGVATVPPSNRDIRPRPDRRWHSRR